MTDSQRPEDSTPPTFMSRRQRREYERRLAQGETPDQAAAAVTQPREHVSDQAAIHDEATGQHPQPLPADGTGSFQQPPRRPVGAQRPYTADLNEDHGGLAPLASDERAYPSEPAASQGTGAQDSEDSLGYLLVADGAQTALSEDTDAQQARKLKKRRRTVVMLLIVAVFIALLVGLGLGIGKLIGLTGANDYPGPGGAETTFEVHPGQGAIVIGNRLVDQDIVASTRAFRQAVESIETSREIQPGEYTLRYEMPARDAAEILLRVGDAGMNYLHVNSGYRIDDVYESIAQRTDYSIDEIEAAADPANFDVPAEASTLEGYVAVGEYHVEWDASAEQILEAMIAPTLEELERLGVDDPAAQHRLVTIASILEAEARPEDFPTVAGIIENRLDPSNTETNGYLQIDATVIYGLGIRQLQFTADDRQDASNEFNTYQHPGLPPGPIGAPSIAALDAAAAPKDSDYMYWITTNIETGETHFSTTYAQHRAYQQEYRAYCEENPDICGTGASQ